MAAVSAGVNTESRSPPSLARLRDDYAHTRRSRRRSARSRAPAAPVPDPPHQAERWPAAETTARLAASPHTAACPPPPRLDHESFAASLPARPARHRLLSGSCSSARDLRYTLPSPRSVTLPQLRFASFALINLRRYLLPQACAHAGRTKKEGARRHPKSTLQQHYNCNINPVRLRRLSAPCRARTALPRSSRSARWSRTGRPRWSE